MYNQNIGMVAEDSEIVQSVVDSLNRVLQENFVNSRMKVTMSVRKGRIYSEVVSIDIESEIEIPSEVCVMMSLLIKNSITMLHEYY